MEDIQQYPTKDSLDLETGTRYTFTYVPSGNKFDGNFEKYLMFNDNLVKALYLSKCTGCNNVPETTGLFYIPIETIDINHIQFADPYIARQSNNEDIILKGGKRRKYRSKNRKSKNRTNKKVKSRTNKKVKSRRNKRVKKY